MARAGRRKGDEIQFRCPYPASHQNGDANPSARYNPQKGAWCCDICKHGGGWTDLCKLLGVEHGQRSRIVATYLYTDESGDPLFEVVRKEPKSFRFRRPDGHGGWIWNLRGVRRALFRPIAEDRLGLPPRAISLGLSSLGWPVELGNAVAAGGS